MQQSQYTFHTSHHHQLIHLNSGSILYYYYYYYTAQQTIRLFLLVSLKNLVVDNNQSESQGCARIASFFINSLLYFTLLYFTLLLHISSFLAQ